MRLSYEPVNIRRRLRRKLKNLLQDRELFLARYLGHAAAAQAYAREQAKVETAIGETFSRRWRKHLRRRTVAA